MMLSGGTRVERSPPSYELRGVGTPATPSNSIYSDLAQPDRSLPQGFVLRLHDLLVTIAEHYAEETSLESGVRTLVMEQEFLLYILEENCKEG
ncbi:hypothetical protein CVT26_014087 [Gymnopilus dilepis]|uniref:Uncharacterized protein n=1 Tax=Gymnopilus dilepis TaxID=231916 RepID=A0A409VX70_9AGAR|nr:hypothetical protein CVT26_014087 [Gymnopilus dilepis]